VSSDSASEEHTWLGTVPGFTEWLGDRKLGSLRADGFSLKNRKWSNGLRVDRDTIVDDKLGLVRPRIQMLAMKARQHRPQLMVEVLANGFDGADPEIGSGLAYDGAFLFSDSHKDGDGPQQSNLGTAALDHAAYGAARRQMRKLVDEYGDPLAVTPSHLLVGPDLEDVGRMILEREDMVESGATVRNIYRGSAELLVSPRLVGPWARYWFLADLTKPVRPLILQIREEIQFAALEEMNNDPAFMRDEHKFGANARYAVGPGLWQLVYGSRGAA
jgi:phage major head subunit gpT-like protein